jgi:hypothetical protein
MNQDSNLQNRHPPSKVVATWMSNLHIDNGSSFVDDDVLKLVKIAETLEDFL